MNFKNSSIHVQRQMNNILRKYRDFVRFYINDIMIFSKILKEHLIHLQKILELLKQINITLKSTKIFLDYFTIELLEQKMNSLDFITAQKKLKAITSLSFSKTLKKLKTYLEMIDYLKDYISYYVQKTKFLQKRKIVLLKNSSIQESKKRSFSRKIIVKESSIEKLDAFEQLQTNFNRFN